MCWGGKGCGVVRVWFHHDDFAKAQVVHEAPEDQDQAVSHGGGEMEAFLETKIWLLLACTGDVRIYA